MTTWTTKDGEELDIKTMETSHIENCIKMLERNIATGKVVGILNLGYCDDDDYQTYEEVDCTDRIVRDIADFQRELDRRSIT